MEFRNVVVFVECKGSILLQREISTWFTLVATNKEGIQIWFDDESQKWQHGIIHT
jgi:hypothetical protein